MRVDGEVRASMRVAPDRAIAPKDMTDQPWVSRTMAKRREKGKIPHSEWPAIRMRYAAGESLASIARDYECTGPAIRYIVNRADAGGAVPQSSPDAAEPTLRSALADVQAPRSEGPVALRPELAGGAPVGRLDGGRSDGAGIDPDLRWRVSSEIASFLAVFDSFLTDNSPEGYDELLSATDRLMRVAARTRIELERTRTAPQSGVSQARPAGVRSRAVAS